MHDLFPYPPAVIARLPEEERPDELLDWTPFAN
jgi:hypothetical protein